MVLQSISASFSKRIISPKRWFDQVIERPAVRRGLDAGKELRASALTDEARQALFGQTAQSVRAGVHKTV